MADKGKSYRGDSFYPEKTEEEAKKESEEEAKTANNPDVIDFETYCAVAGISDEVRRAAMKVFTKTQKATKEGWDAIYERF